MKKTYTNPTIQVVEIEVRQMLAASPNGAHDEIGGGTQLGREYDDFSYDE